eukprot:911226-Pelagomonas_calceolata.AAC.1
MESFFLKRWFDPDTPHLYTKMCFPCMRSQYAPAENARLFHQRCSTFLKDYMCCKNAAGNPLPGLLSK